MSKTAIEIVLKRGLSNPLTGVWRPLSLVLLCLLLTVDRAHSTAICARASARDAMVDFHGRDPQIEIWTARSRDEVELAKRIEDQVIETLNSGRIVSEVSAGVGVDFATFVTFENGIQAVWKTKGRPHAEIAAYRYDRYLRLNRVPITLGRTRDNDFGSLQLKVNDLRGEPQTNYPLALGIVDFLFAMPDRHAPNYLLARDGRIVLIDHGIALMGYRRMVVGYEILKSELKDLEDIRRGNVVVAPDERLRLFARARNTFATAFIGRDFIERVQQIDRTQAEMILVPLKPTTEQIDFFVASAQEVFALYQKAQTLLGADFLPEVPISPLISITE